MVEKIFYGIAVTPLLYAIYNLIKIISHNKPVLTFTESGIKIQEKGEGIFFNWPQVIGYEIEESNDNGGSFLTIKTINENKIISLSWLEKPPSKIEKLLSVYTKQ